MSNTYQISIATNATTKDGGKVADVVQQITAHSDQATRISAQNGVVYTLTDLRTGKAPQQIHTKRRGKDLLIQLDEFRPNDSADLVLENFYDQDSGFFVGTAEDEISYPFIPNTANPQHQIGALVDGASITQVLGGAPMMAAAPLVATAGLGAVGALGALGPLGAGLAALAGAAALGGSGGGGSGSGSGSGNSPDTTSPTASKVPLEAKLKPADNSGLSTDTQTNKRQPTFEGKTAPGNQVFVTLDSGVEQEISPVNADGSWSWTPSVLTEGEHTVRVKAKDPKDPTGTPAEQTITLLIDTSALGVQINNAPSLNSSLSDGVLNIAELGGAAPEIPLTLSLNDNPNRDLIADDLQVTGGSIKPGSFRKISPTEYAVSVLPPATPSNNTGRIDVTVKTTPSPALTDDAGNPLAAVIPKVFNYDNKAPTAAITSNFSTLNVLADSVLNSAELANGVTFTLTLDSIPNRQISLSDLVLTGGVLANTLTRVSDTEYTVKAQPTADTNSGQLQLTLRAATGTTLSDVALNSLGTVVSPIVNYDTKSIGVAITSNREALDQGVIKDGVLNNTELANGVTFTLTFDNAPARDIVPADLVFAGGAFALDSLSKVSNTVYRVTAQPTAARNAGMLKLTLQPATPLNDASGNSATSASSAEISYDTKALTVAGITSNLSVLDTVSNSVLNIAELAGGGVTFRIFLDSAPQRDLGTGDLLVSAGGSLQAGSLRKVNATEYTAVLTPASTTDSGSLKLSLQASTSNPLTDAAGNPLTAADGPAVSFDNKAPVVSLISSAIENLPFDRDFQVRANTTDNDLSGMSASFLGEVKTLSRANSNSVWQFELNQAGLTNVSNGYYTFKLTATDSAGNSTETEQVFKLNRGFLPALWTGTTPAGDVSDNTFINTDGNQTFQGNGGADNYVWLARDSGMPGAPDTDTIVDFSVLDGANKDRLNIRDLLGGVTNATLNKHLKITQIDTDSVPGLDSMQVAISRLGRFTGTNDSAVADQLIVLKNVLLTDANLINLATNLQIDWNTTFSQPLFG